MALGLAELALVTRMEQVEREQKKQRIAVETLTRQAVRTVTSFAEAGQYALENATVIHPTGSQDFPLKDEEVPLDLDTTFKNQWGAAANETQLQVCCNGGLGRRCCSGGGQ